MPSHQEELAWDHRLWRYRGSPRLLKGLRVYTEFLWEEVFDHGRMTFKGGLELAILIDGQCESGKTPALLLTRRDTVREGVHPHAEFYIVVVNIDRYRAAANRTRASGYFAAVGVLGSGQSTLLAQAGTYDLQMAARLLSESPDETRAFIDSFVAEQGLRSLLAGREGEALEVATEELGDESWRYLSATLAFQRVLDERRRTLESFGTHMEEGDWNETEWQEFFVENLWLFGFGLDFQFLHVVWDQPYTGGRSFMGSGGIVGDYLLASGGTMRFTMLVEIKRPDTQLLSETQRYRTRVWRPASELVGAVAQLQRQTAQWTRTAGDPENADELDLRNVYTHEPRSMLIIGNTSQLFRPEGTVDRDRMFAFEGFRRNLSAPDILTFDELHNRAAAALSSQNIAPLVPPRD